MERPKNAMPLLLRADPIRPSNGIATMAAYSKRCNALEAVVCHAGTLTGSGAGGCHSRQIARQATSARMTIPIDLCRLKSHSLPGSSSIATMIQPTPTMPINRIASNQCSAKAVGV